MTEEWEKVLWKKQPYPDNYIPSTFLSSLRLNANFQPYTYWPLVLAASTISQHVSSIFIFLVTFARLYDESWDPRILVWLSVCMFLLGLVLWELLERFVLGFQIGKEQRAKTLKSSILVFLALLALSPVLRTLSASTSSDSIWALTACLFILNLLLADYGPSRSRRLGRERLTSVLSVNAAMSASVVLASRLRDDISVFALMLFSVQMFALLPLLRARLLMMPPYLRALLTLCFAGVSVHLTSGLSQLVTGIQVVILGFITFGAPWVLVWAQKFKKYAYFPYFPGYRVVYPALVRFEALGTSLFPKYDNSTVLWVPINSRTRVFDIFMHRTELSRAVFIISFALSRRFALPLRLPLLLMKEVYMLPPPTSMPLCLVRCSEYARTRDTIQLFHRWTPRLGITGTRLLSLSERVW